MNDTHYDLIILGGGAAAFAAAIRANGLGARTKMINAGLPLGGTCVNVGCVPSKALLFVSELLHLARSNPIPGVEMSLREVDFRKVVAHERALVAQMRREKYESVLANLSSVSFEEGWAHFRSPHEVEVNGQRYTADAFVVATGSRTAVPPIPGLQEAGFITHIEALQQERLPKSLAVVGGGPMGLEFAQLFARFGVEVTLLQRDSTIFPQGEPEAVAQLAAILQQEGIAIVTNAQVQEVRQAEEGLKEVVFSDGDQQRTIAVEEILLATGRTPNTGRLAVDQAGIKLDERGAIIVDEALQTTASHIFAAGDVTNAPLRLETTAGHEGTIAAENALRGTRHTLDYTSVPFTIFTDPQLAGVGLTERQLMAQLGRCACRTVPFSYVPKARILGRTEGLIKMVVHPDDGRILGVHILAPSAGELIAQAMVLVKKEMTIDEVAQSLPVFPTLSEAIKLAALAFRKDIAHLSCCV